MKLTIKRSQTGQKGVFGGHKGVSFSLSVRAVLTDDEQKVFDYYGLIDHPLVSDYTTGAGSHMVIRLSDLLKGFADTNGIGRLVAVERQIKEECEQVKALVGIMSDYGGEQALEF